MDFLYIMSYGAEEFEMTWCTSISSSGPSSFDICLSAPRFILMNGSTVNRARGRSTRPSYSDTVDVPLRHVHSLFADVINSVEVLFIVSDFYKRVPLQKRAASHPSSSHLPVFFYRKPERPKRQSPRADSSRCRPKYLCGAMKHT